jgi:hypothetical protein
MIPQSDIHAKYGDWRKNMNRFGDKYKILSTTDIDVIETTSGNYPRCWVEASLQKEGITAILDLKYRWDGTTKTELITFKGLSKHYQIFLVFITNEDLTDYTPFLISPLGSDRAYIIPNGKEYAEWLLQLRMENHTYYTNYKSINISEIKDYNFEEDLNMDTLSRNEIERKEFTEKYWTNFPKEDNI